MSAVKFREATAADVGLILQFIRALAEYEKMSGDVVATEEILREWLFEKNSARVIFAMEGAKEGFIPAITGPLKNSAAGIGVAVTFGYSVSMIFNPKSPKR